MQDAFIKTVQHFSELVAQVTSEQWEQTSPATPDWTIQQLVSHAIDDNGAVCKAFGGSDELTVTIDQDPAAAWRESAENAETHVRAVTDLDQIVHGMMGDMPAASFLNTILGDLLLHSHDLAVAIGADTKLDPELVILAYDFMSANAANIAASGMFGPAVEVAANAPLQEKLLGLSGRRPA